MQNCRVLLPVSPGPGHLGFSTEVSADPFMLDRKINYSEIPERVLCEGLVAWFLWFTKPLISLWQPTPEHKTGMRVKFIWAEQVSLLICLSSKYVSIFKTEAVLSCAWALWMGGRVYTEKKSKIPDGSISFLQALLISVGSLYKWS